MGSLFVLKTRADIKRGGQISRQACRAFRASHGIHEFNLKKDKKDIKKAILALGRLPDYNFSQGVVVRNSKVIAIEGKTGTSKMLKKFQNIKFKNKGVLAKFPKKKQDLRIDLPTLGLKTLTECKYAGLKGIVLKSKRNIFLESKRCINFADKNKMFITVK